jgi:hypothetical protein
VAGLEACKNKNIPPGININKKISYMKLFKLLRMKRLFPFLFLMVTGSIAFAQGNAGEKLYVNNPNGTARSFVIDNINKLTFTGENVTIHSTAGAASFVYAAIESITFFEKYPTGLKTPDNTAVKVFYDAAKNLVIESSEAIASVGIYNLQGVLVQSHRPGGLSTSIPFASYPAGVYPVVVRSDEGKVSVHKIVIH